MTAPDTTPGRRMENDSRDRQDDGINDGVDRGPDDASHGSRGSHDSHDSHDSHGQARADGGDASVVLAEERLRTAVVREPVQRVRLRREVVTEEIMVPVTVRREVLRIETLDIPRGQRAPSAAGAREPLEIVLHEDRPVVTVETVAVERVRIEVVEVSGTQTVEADLAVEQIEVEQIAVDQAEVVGTDAADARER